MTRLTAGDFLAIGHGLPRLPAKARQMAPPGRIAKPSFVAEGRFDSSESNISNR
jgi:hypothetical protein